MAPCNSALMKKTRLRQIAFATACVAVLVVAWKHGDAAVAVVTGAFAIIAALTGIQI